MRCEDIESRLKLRLMMQKNKSLRALDLFAGIGGVRIGFEAAGFEIIYSNDFDKKAAETYRLNFDEIDVDNLFNVTKEKGMNRIPKKFEILLGGFPCQPFSVAGNKKGFDDDRGHLLFAIVDILKAKKPDAVFLENVKHLQHHDDERTFKRVKKELQDAGYEMDARVFNSMHYGNVPQSRERIYIVAFRSARTLMKFKWPSEIKLTKNIHSILEPNPDSRYYYTEKDKFIYPKLKKAVVRKDRFYQYRRVYVREIKNGMAPTLTASMGMGGHNVPIVKDNTGIRKLTPRECARLQGFPESFQFPATVSEGYHYKQIGNSVTVPVIKRIAENIRIALET